MRRLAFLLLATVAPMVLGVAGAARADDAADALDRDLATVNQLARAHYARATAAALAASGPVIVVEPDQVSLRLNGSEQRETYSPPRYHRLKSIGHVALGLYAVLAPIAERGDLGGSRVDLEAYRGAIAALVPQVPALGLRWDDSNRQREILAKAIALMDGVLATGTVSRADLRRYADDIAPALLGNGYDATSLQLTALHETIERWRGTLTPDDWARLQVVVLGPSRPREVNPALEYFKRRVGPSRVLAAENIRDPAAGLDLLASTVFDRDLGDSFFSDRARFEHGLLTDGARRQLDRLLGAP